MLVVPPSTASRVVEIIPAVSEDGGATSYFRLTTNDDLVELLTMAKSLRNLRDRLARNESWLFEDLAFCGLADGENVHLIVSHPNLAREQVQQRLRALWPEKVLTDVPTTPVFDLSPKLVATLGSLRRGLQPARFVVLPRRSC